jgi:hypothetical protein
LFTPYQNACVVRARSQDCSVLGMRPRNTPHRAFMTVEPMTSSVHVQGRVSFETETVPFQCVRQPMCFAFDVENLNRFIR